MLWILILDLFASAQGEFRCSGHKLTIESSCGDTVTLPCHFSWAGSPPPRKYELVWQLRQHGDDFVVHDDDMMTPANQQQNSMFTNRTYVQEHWGQHGNATLRITEVSESDQGVYTCDLLSPRPYDRKICTVIQLVVKTYSPDCGTRKPRVIKSGDSLQLSCISRPRCLSPPNRGFIWRFMAADSEMEVELPSERSDDVEVKRITAYTNGTLSLQGASTSESGTYCCYLKGTEKCQKIQIQVLVWKRRKPRVPQVEEVEEEVSPPEEETGTQNTLTSLLSHS
ncbi:uncharacterized protein [Ambystoma mexicanum]|uniref:uncharacterized protein isoform X2 n=1 Tax=Ambystoma mexicanum TaxID=8296 RepID=UPI0037E78A0E